MKKIVIGHLYPKQMNVYGDIGNVITLRYRLEQRGIGVRYVPMESLKTLTEQKVDILVGGGGQDSNQELVQNDLRRHANELKSQCENGLVALMICGMYQLLGRQFVLPDGSKVDGAGVLDLETHAGSDRLIGNVVIDSSCGMLVGFENHSGRTFLGGELEPLGRVVSGAGNNGEDGTEGALYKNVFGTYMHGPCLAKNPLLADELIKRALARQGASGNLTSLDDTLECKAAEVAMKRPR